MSSNIFKIIQPTVIKGKKAGPALLILAGVHGDEYEPIAAAIALLKSLPGVLTGGTVTIVPVVNYSAFKMASRTGEDGLDIARICPGNINGSLSERAAAEVSQLISVSDYLIDLHGGGNRYQIDPMSGYMLHASPDVLEKQRVMARAFNLKTTWGTSNRLNGRTLSVARDHNVPAIYTEYGGGGGFRKSIVKEYVQGSMNVLNMLGMYEGPITTGRCEYEVEDHREDSGHLQVLLPATCDGLFETEVSLGQFVKRDQIIGTISIPYGGESMPVYADKDGMVFMLRAIPSVEKGETMGGILPIDKPGNVTIL